MTLNPRQKIVVSLAQVKNHTTFVCLFSAVLGLCCCTRAFSIRRQQGLLFLAVAAAAAAKSLQSCPTLCDPIDGSPPGSSVHGIFQARVLEWGAIAFSLPCSARIYCCGFSCCRARALGSQASVVVGHRLRCPMACGIFLDQWSNLCPLHWQADS